MEGPAASKKKGDAALKDIAEGEATRTEILKVLSSLDATALYKSRPAFDKVLKTAAKTRDGIAAPVLKAILSALSERDETAEACEVNGMLPEP